MPFDFIDLTWLFFRGLKPIQSCLAFGLLDRSVMRVRVFVDMGTASCVKLGKAPEEDLYLTAEAPKAWLFGLLTSFLCTRFLKGRRGM
ncbi:hypothetical protein GW17_00012556 [Ensete ventricosum]|nr:hypothetical protein GW17_00012556 [Ensete ventricosum]